MRLWVLVNQPPPSILNLDSTTNWQSNIWDRVGRRGPGIEQSLGKPKQMDSTRRRHELSTLRYGDQANSRHAPGWKPVLYTCTVQYSVQSSFRVNKLLDIRNTFGVGLSSPRAKSYHVLIIDGAVFGYLNYNRYWLNLILKHDYCWNDPTFLLFQ